MARGHFREPAPASTPERFGERRVQYSLPLDLHALPGTRFGESDPSGRRAVPEWWGLRAEGELVQVIRWSQATPPTLSDFHPPLLAGVEYEIAPLHATAVE